MGEVRLVSRRSQATCRFLQWFSRESGSSGSIFKEQAYEIEWSRREVAHFYYEKGPHCSLHTSLIISSTLEGIRPFVPPPPPAPP